MILSNIQSFASQKVNRSVCLTYITLLIITAVLLVVGVGAPASALTGSGTSNDPYKISTADDLAQFRDIVNDGDNDAWGTLTNDIDMSQLSDAAERENWTPIGDNSISYIGTFNGAGYVINNLKIGRTYERYTGLFGCVYANGAVNNLSITGTIVSEAWYVGGIVGYNYGMVSNCNNFSNVTGGLYVGGVVGLNYGTVTNCNNSGTLTGYDGSISDCRALAGIVGCNSGNLDFSGIVANCVNYGFVNNVGDTSTETGGIVGRNTDTLTNCTNFGDVTGTKDVGGIVGLNVNGGEIGNSCNIGKVTGTTNIGSIVGENLRDLVTNCGWLQGTHSVGLGYNTGASTNAVSFTSAQQSSVVTTAIPSINKTTLYADKRETATISFTTYPSEPSNRFNAASGFMRNIMAESDAPGIVSIVSVTQSSGTVILRAQGSGTAKITVTADLYSTNFASVGNYITEPTQVEFTYYVTSIVPLEGISLSTNSLTLAPGSSTELSVIYSPENATNKNVTWTCSNPELIRLESTTTPGTVKLTALGTTIAPVTVTAQAEEGDYTASCSIAVREPSVTVTVKTAAEGGLYPDFGTFYVSDLSNGAVVEYPGVPVGKDGIMTCTILAQEKNYRLGVSLLNSLVSGIEASQDTEDFTDRPLYMIEGDTNSNNIIDGTDYTILVQRMHFGGGLSEYGLVGDLNYDGAVDDSDLMFFNSPVTHTGESRFMQKGFDMMGSSAETHTIATNSCTVTHSPVLQIEPTAPGSYEVSFKEATEPANMLQLALAGDIYNAVLSLPEGYELIGEHYCDGRTTVAIGNTAKDGVSIPADTPLLSVQSASEPRIDYAHSALQKATEAGIIDFPLTGGSSSLIDVPTPAAPVIQPSFGGSSGCNMGIGIFALLAAVPLFFTRKR